jgi:hypothetical protein
MGQSRVDDPRAGTIGPAEFLLDGLDQLIAVARLFSDQLQQDVAQIAVIENTTERPAPATTMMVAVTAKPSASEAEGASCVPLTMGPSKSEYARNPL